MWEKAFWRVTSTGLKQKKEKELEIWEKQGTRKLLWPEPVEEGKGTRKQGVAREKDSAQSLRTSK